MGINHRAAQIAAALHNVRRLGYVKAHPGIETTLYHRQYITRDKSGGVKLTPVGETFLNTHTRTRTH